VFEKSKGIQSCVGLVPNGDDLSNQILVEERDEWVLQLNQWMSSQVASIIANPAYNSPRDSRAGHALFLYASTLNTPSTNPYKSTPSIRTKIIPSTATAPTLPPPALSWRACWMTPPCRCPCPRTLPSFSNDGDWIALCVVIPRTAMLPLCSPAMTFRFEKENLIVVPYTSRTHPIASRVAPRLLATWLPTHHPAGCHGRYFLL
jgi:hypothetical protein